MKKRSVSILIIVLMVVFTTISIGTTKVNPKLGKIDQRDMIYFIMTDRFLDSDKTNNKDVIKGDLSQYNGGDFQGIINKLDYIKNLGFTAIWISPVVKNDIGGYHGYWATDFYKTNEHFGSMAKLKELVNKAHDKGIKVIFDIVLNHTGPGHPFVNNPKYPNWFHEQKNISDYNNQQEVENGWLAGLPDFNTENPAVRKYLIDMAKWWIKQTGIDGYRIDTVRHIPKDFWVEFSKEIKKTYPDFYTVGEVFNGDPGVVGDYQTTGLSGLLDFPTYYAVNDVIKGDKPATDLANLINAEGDLYKNRNLMGTFIDNHDVNRFVNQVYRFKQEKLEAALTFMMTYTGIPIMYYGTEIAMEGGTDPDNRAMMDFNVKSPVTAYVKKLTAIRKSNAALTYGNIEVIGSEESFLAYARQYKDSTVIASFNTSEEAQKYTLEIPENYRGKSLKMTDLISGKTINIIDGKVILDMKPIQASVFIVK